MLLRSQDRSTEPARETEARMAEQLASVARVAEQPASVARAAGHSCPGRTPETLYPRRLRRVPMEGCTRGCDIVAIRRSLGLFPLGGPSVAEGRSFNRCDRVEFTQPGANNGYPLD